MFEGSGASMRAERPLELVTRKTRVLDAYNNFLALFLQAASYATEFREPSTERKHRPDFAYRECLRVLDAPTPEAGKPGEAVIDELVQRVTPGLHMMTGPRFFGWVAGASHPVRVAADWLTAAWGQIAANHHAAPAAAAIETVVSRWLLDILDLPRDASVGLVTGATVAHFVCLAAARSELLRRVGWDVEAKGLFGAPPIHVFVGEEAHATVFSALQFLGFGRDSVVSIPADHAGRMRPDALAAAIANCDGPILLVLQAGQINTGAFDDHAALIPLARMKNAWIHVDGAFGMWARACPNRAHLARDLNKADSWATDGHKWLQTPHDCGYAIVRDADAHRRAMTIAGSCLPTVGEGERDPSHFVPEFSRRARGFATWAMLRHLGREGIAAMVSEHCRLARRMAERLTIEPGIKVLNEVALNQVIVRFGVSDDLDEGNRLTAQVIKTLQADGTLFLSGAEWHGE